MSDIGAAAPYLPERLSLTGLRKAARDLRAPDDESRQRERALFVDDLRVAAGALAS